MRSRSGRLRLGGCLKTYARSWSRSRAVTGLATRSRLRDLASILDRHDAVVVEDSALADLTFSGRVRPELADLCRHAVVASVGSFSKVGWGGLRIGWMRAPAPLIARTMHLRIAGDLGP